MPLHLVAFTSTPVIQLTSLNTPYSGFRAKVPLSPVQTTCSAHLTLFAEDYHYKLNIMLLRHMTPCSVLGRWRWRQRVPANVGAYPSNYTRRHMPHNLYDKTFYRWQPLCHKSWNFSREMSVRLLRQNVVSRFNTVVTLCWSFVMRDQVCHRDKTSDKFTVFCKCVYQWRNLTRRSGLVEG